MDRVRYDGQFDLILKYGTIFWLMLGGILLIYFVIKVMTGTEISERGWEESKWVLILITFGLITIVIIYFKITKKIFKKIWTGKK